MPVLNFEVSDRLKRRLEAEAERDARSQSAVVRLALEVYLGSCERADDAEIERLLHRPDDQDAVDAYIEHVSKGRKP